MTEYIQSESVPVFQKTNEAVCRFCGLSAKDLYIDDIVLFSPCNCAAPICRECLQIYKNITKKINCEICGISYFRSTDPEIKNYNNISYTTRITNNFKYPQQSSNSTLKIIAYFSLTGAIVLFFYIIRFLY
jgi:hypothetical protein